MAVVPAVAAAFQIVDGAQVIGAGMLRGLMIPAGRCLRIVRLLDGRTRNRRLAGLHQDWKGVSTGRLPPACRVVAALMIARWVCATVSALPRLDPFRLKSGAAAR